MLDYIRSQIAGATYFFTLTLVQRNTRLLTQNINLLRQAYQRANTFQLLQRQDVEVVKQVNAGSKGNWDKSLNASLQSNKV